MALYKPYTRYKNAGLSWLKEIPENWEVISFKNILKERNEKNDPIKSTERLSLSIDKGVTLYSEKTTNLDRFKDDFTQYKLAYKNDLVFNSMNMIVGAVGVSKYFGCVSPVYYTYYSQDNNPSASKFYEYLFKCKTIQGVLFSLGKGLIAIDRGDGKYNTLRLKISREDLRSLKLPIPEQTEQTAIVRFLDYKAAKINRFIFKKKQLIKLLNEQKAAIINQAVTKGLNPNVKMKDSVIEWLGEIPEHWEVRKLKYVANCFPSNIDKHSNEDEKQVRLCNYTNVYKNDYITDSMDLMLATATDEQIEKFTLLQGDVIITKDSETANDIAVPAYVKEPLTNVVCGYHLSVLRPYETLYGEFLFRALQCKEINIQFEVRSNGVTRVGLGVYDLKNAKIPVPPINEQTKIVEFISKETSTIYTTISTIEKEIALVEEYKTALITEAVLGKIDVRTYQFPETETEDEGYEELEEELALVAEESIDYQTEEME
ncbi:restriction endonuclease subunit S [Myroides sp. 1354]|uniref:restriction endonuclease subunit S n=1 Tax=unclassified Myroides TaxID=2642485 RepID=UPI002577EBBD|nr:MULTISPECIES: restriction endonuclease subunit S [unclassified Myroides]MDM1044718.1 restriction endonuclease subunit S [Myroides sp. R163-1]MDM1055431.1 restriction endonuclease subunit S [Myroides sp. 1354]MDM1068728.1 restriction endonuclease subunit S [Myroides sp. 1372]